MDEEKMGLPPEGHFRGGRKKVFWIVIGAFLALFVLVVGLVAWRAFDTWRGRESVELLYEGLKRGQEELYQRQLADTYGGTTPQETLQMYIEAVEAGDYELASKYFIEENRGREIDSSNKLTPDKLGNYINLLNLALDKLDTEGKYDSDEKYFSIYEPIYIGMVLYPNGIWKIVEI